MRAWHEQARSPIPTRRGGIGLHRRFDPQYEVAPRLRPVAGLKHIDFDRVITRFGLAEGDGEGGDMLALPSTSRCRCCDRMTV